MKKDKNNNIPGPIEVLAAATPLLQKLHEDFMKLAAHSLECSEKMMEIEAAAESEAFFRLQRKRAKMVQSVLSNAVNEAAECFRAQTGLQSQRLRIDMFRAQTEQLRVRCRMTEMEARLETLKPRPETKRTHQTTAELKTKHLRQERRDEQDTEYIDRNRPSS